MQLIYVYQILKNTITPKIYKNKTDLYILIKTINNIFELLYSLKVTLI